MNPIIINQSIRQKYMAGFHRQSQPIEIVMHGTGGGTSSHGMIDWMLGGERAAEYNKGIALFHYLIDRDGQVTEIISPSNWVYHSSSGLHDMLTIGIEHIKPDALNTTEPTDEQYQSDLEMIVFLMNQYPINSIIGHVQNTLKYSGPQYVKVPCPGIYDWVRLQTMLQNAGYEFNLETEHLIKIS
jgi:hypothetical protein